MAIEMTTQTARINAVINFKDDNEINSVIGRLEQFCSSGYTYYAILHDKDVDELGVLKTKHLHLILVSRSYTRASTWLRRIKEVTNVEDNQISLQHCDNIVASVQYLIHQNSPSKYQYERSDILTSESIESINNLLAQEPTKELSVKYIGEMFESLRGNKMLFIDVIGLTRYNQNYRAINEIWQYFADHEKSVRDNNLLQSDKLNKDIEKELPF